MLLRCLIFDCTCVDDRNCNLFTSQGHEEVCIQWEDRHCTLVTVATGAAAGDEINAKILDYYRLAFFIKNFYNNNRWISIYV